MTREEAVAYLRKLKKDDGFCFICQRSVNKCGEHCKIEELIAYLSRPTGDRLIEVLREVRGEK